MRIISDAYRDAALSDSLEPIFVAKIITQSKNIYLTTRQVTITDVGSTQLQGRIVNGGANAVSQQIKPEAGLSSIGNGTITIADPDGAFTAELNALEVAGQSIYNDKVEMYVGFATIGFADFVQVNPLYVKTFQPDEVGYTLTLSDTQRITQKSLFADPSKTELVGNYGFEDTANIEVVSPAGYPLVEHGPDWIVDPNLTVGYLKVFGISKDGREVKEVISYTGTNATQFTGVQRGRMGTERVNLSATDNSGNPVTVELIEMVYIDLPQPLMVQALLTGDYGIIGQSLPDKWHAGLPASLINSTSFANIGGDLYDQFIEFRDLDTADAKEFIAKQCLAPYGTFLRIDQLGQYELARYDYVNQQSMGDVVLDYSNITNLSKAVRDAGNLNNFFELRWEWRIDQDYYARRDYYIAGDEQVKYKYESPLETIELRGLRNRDKTSKPTLDFVAQAIVKRKVNPSVRRSVTCKLHDVLALEVGDTITLNAANEPDYRTLGSYQETFEVQGISFDFFAGTATLKLFASEGTPPDFTIRHGQDVLSIGHVGWTNLDGTPYGSNVAGTFIFNNGATIPTGKYFFNGDVEVPASATIQTGNEFYLDCSNFSMGANAKINAKGRGPAGGQGYFGLGDTAQGGVHTSGLIATRPKVWFGAGQSSLNNASKNIDLPDVIRIADGDQIESVLPLNLYGTGGPKGGDVVTGLVTTGSKIGGSATSGGGSIVVICDSFQSQSSSIIDVSGNDSNLGGVAVVNPPVEGILYRLQAGSSGFGQSGTCIVCMKDRAQPKPFLYDLVIANNGQFLEPSTALSERRITWGSNTFRTLDDEPSGGRFNRPKLPDNVQFSLADNSTTATKVISLVTAEDHIPEAGVDDIDEAPAPAFTYIEQLNTPRTPLGDQITYELTVTPNSAIDYVEFEYRLPTGEWNPANYRLSLESIIQVTGTGDTYEVRATAYNRAKKAGGSSVQTIVTPKIERNPEETQAPGLADDVKVPEIKGLELVNRINDQAGWNQWKSPNAEFQWKRSSFTAQASISNLNGYVDLHLEGYLVRVSKITGELLREELIKENSYIYTYDKNKKDTNGAPVREIRFQVQAVSNTGHASEFAKIEVSNPAPAAPASVVFDADYKSITATYDLPSDIDFIGVDTFIITGTGDPYEAEPLRKQGNQVVWPDLINGQAYTIGLRSVDQFGNGGQITPIGVTVDKIPTTDLADIDSTLNISAGGLVVTDNGGFVAFHGAIDAPSESVNPLIFGAYDGVNFPFWINTDGDFKFGTDEKSITFDGQLRLGREAVFAGNDSYGNDYLYKNIIGFDSFSTDATVNGPVISSTAGGKATDISYTGVGTISNRVSLYTGVFSFGFVNFDLECRLKVKGSFSNGSDDDVFILSVGDGIDSALGFVLLQFRGLGGGDYAVRVASKEQNQPTIIMPPASFPVGSYSSEHTVSLSGTNTIEIAYLSKDKIEIFINDTRIDQLGVNYTGASNFFPSASLPSDNPVLVGLGVPYFNITILDSGTGTTAKALGDVKFMNAPL